MKKKLSLLTSIVLSAVTVSFGAAGCATDLYEEYKDSIDTEMRLSFDFFWNECVTDESLPTYGLIVDRWPGNDNYASTASVGFGLTAYVIGAEEGWVTREEAQERSLGTLETILAIQADGENEASPNYHDVAYEGFLAHFIDTRTAARYGDCEISSVDTAILLCGALTVGEYFGGEVAEAAEEVYSNVNWNAFIKELGGRTLISMAYDPDTGIVSNGCWDWYAEQLMIYVLGAGSPVEEYRLDDEAYYDFTRRTGSYGDSGEFIYSYFGSIFTYQYSHAWIDFRGKTDKNGTDWWTNSVNASRANYNYCRDMVNSSATFAAGGWGLTACDAPNGYNGYLGTPARGWQPNSEYYRYEGTVAPAGAIGSVVFTPEESLEALEYYQSLRLLNGAYGLNDSYNLDYDFYASDCIGIDKGISLLMLANFKNEVVWSVFMQNEHVLSGLENLGFSNVR